jgi:thymidylate synthase (FAD)
MESFPVIDAEVFRTPSGTPYLRQPGVVVLAVPDTRLQGLDGFLKGFDESFQFPQYLDDPTPLGPVERLCKLAGQLCYMSFGPKRTLNAEAEKYFFNIKSSGHGSVLEHANVTVLLYGISRSLTHELVRHRAGFGFSQVSQRYVSGRTLRFVERPEFVGDAQLHSQFEARIDRAAAEYEAMSDRLEEMQAAGNTAILTAEQKTDLRKKVRQVAGVAALHRDAREQPLRDRDPRRRVQRVYLPAAGRPDHVRRLRGRGLPGRDEGRKNGVQEGVGLGTSRQRAIERS